MLDKKHGDIGVNTTIISDENILKVFENTLYFIKWVLLMIIFKSQLTLQLRRRLQPVTITGSG